MNFDSASPKIRFFHCKASSQESPGARQKDFHELCCQALRTSPWLDIDKLAKRIKYRSGTKVPGFRSCGEDELTQLVDLGRGITAQFEVYLVQPGLNRAAISAQILEILGGIAGYLHHAGAEQLSIIAS